MCSNNVKSTSSFSGRILRNNLFDFLHLKVLKKSSKFFLTELFKNGLKFSECFLNSAHIIYIRTLLDRWLKKTKQCVLWIVTYDLRLAMYFSALSLSMKFVAFCSAKPFDSQYDTDRNDVMEKKDWKRVIYKKYMFKFNRDKVYINQFSYRSWLN